MARQYPEAITVEAIEAAIGIKSLRQLAEELGVDRRQVEKFARKHGIQWQSAHMRPVPKDLVEFILSQERVTRRAIARHYGVKHDTSARWVSTLPKHVQDAVAYGQLKLELPEDWPARAKYMPRKELMAHYGIGDIVLNRWISESKITPPYAPGYVPKSSTTQQIKQMPVPPVAPDQHAQAAHYIRRWFSNVHRADILETETGITWGEMRGLPDKGKGKYFVGGLGIVANDDVVEIARARGWREV